MTLSLSSCADVYYNGSGAMTGATRYMEGYGGVPSRYSEHPVDHESWWRGDGVSGPSRIVIHLGDQKALYYKGGKLVGVSSISSGDEEHRTPTGTFSLVGKNMTHRSSQYGDYVDGDGNVVMENIDRNVDRAPPGTRYLGSNMPYFMRFNKGIGMHAGYLPGYPASHGCVRMPREMAQAFFRNASIGTPVEVRH